MRTLPRGRRAASWLLLGFTLFFPAWVRAQFDQYTAPGGPTDRPRDRKELLEEYLKDARWRLGPLRVDPWFSLSDIEYVDNSFGTSESEGEEPDVTATVGAGLRGYLPAGPDVVLALHFMPEYLWWKDDASRRRLNGRYGVGFFGFFNRVGVEATASRTQQRGIVSPEFPQMISARADRARLGAQVQVSGHLSVFASAEDAAVKNLLDSEELADPRTAPFDLLDRDARTLRGGLRYEFPRRWSVGLGVERSDVDFDVPPGPNDRSNSGTSPLLLIEREGTENFLSFEVSQRKLDPKPGSVFVPYDETAFSLFAGFNTEGRLGWSVYGRRGIVYSLQAGYSYLQDDRVGLVLEYGLGWRTRLHVFVEAGRDDYTAETALVPDRQDDEGAYGATVSFAANKRVLVSLRLSRTAYDSNLPGEDRKLTTLGVTLGFGTNRPSW